MPTKAEFCSAIDRRPSILNENGHINVVKIGYTSLDRRITLGGNQKILQDAAVNKM